MSKLQKIIIFNSAIVRLMNFIEKKFKSDAEFALIRRLKNRYQAVLNTLGNHVFIQESIKPLMKYKDQIINRDEQFFLLVDPKQVGMKIEKEDDFIYQLIDIVKKQYTSYDQLSKNKIWDEVKILFETSCEYYILEN